MDISRDSDEIEQKSLEDAISKLARNARKNQKKDAWLAHKSTEYGDNEFFEGMASAYENCLRLIKLRKN